MLANFSDAIDKVTRDAVGHAVVAVPRLNQHWLLPLILGGDDLTFLADARVALRVLREFQTAFAEYSAGDEVIAEVTGKVRQHLEPDTDTHDASG